MEYPLQVELDISQDDFISVEILEQELDMQLAKKSYKKGFVMQSIFCIAMACVVFALRNIIMLETIYFVIGAWLILLFNFLINYFSGCKKEFSFAVTHILENKDDHTFFTPEKGMAFFYEDKAEYLTNEQRRYFDYDKIQNIKITRHLFIFVMKRSKEKAMQGFAYMIIPRRNLTDDEDARLNTICENIVEKYELKEWMKSEIMD